jgi:intein/homing endonuclease
MTKKVSLFLLILSAVLIIGCNENDSVSNPVLGKGKFIVDSLTYNITLEKAFNDSLWHFVDTRMIYHFENYRGILNKVVFIVNDSLVLVIYLDYAYPDSVNKFIPFHQKIGVMKKLNDGDSIKVERSLFGAFFEVEGNNYHLVDTFYLYNKDILYYHE